MKRRVRRVLKRARRRLRPRRFVDRRAAGAQLARKLAHLEGEAVVVLGLPRGGVPVAAVVASALNAPLDVVIVRKLGVPDRPQLAFGAVGEHGVRVLFDGMMQWAGLGEDDVREVERHERRELEQRAAVVRAAHPAVDLAGRVAVLVDDGIATGATVTAAARTARELGATRVVVATPVGARRALGRLQGVADDVVAVKRPRRPRAIGQWYTDFSATTEEEVLRALRRSTTVGSRRVEIAVRDAALPGVLAVPHHATGIVLFAHGTGSNHASPRNQEVAELLNDAGFATLLFDLHPAAEARAHRGRGFPIELIGTRLADTTRWLRTQPDIADLPFGYFGASTGGAAAMWAAAEPDLAVSAVVSRGGRPDLALDRLADVTAPTLLIVGERDVPLRAWNEEAAACLAAEHELRVVPRAGHLFAEPGTLAAAAELTTAWFERHLPVAGVRA